MQQDKKKEEELESLKKDKIALEQLREQDSKKEQELAKVKDLANKAISEVHQLEVEKMKAQNEIVQAREQNLKTELALTELKHIQEHQETLIQM